jgi:hypothetical protein
MALRDIKLDIKKGKKPIDPLEIFKSLTLRGSIENIWGPQQEALQIWHKKYRNHNDNIIEMNTGGGKTLVGLLVAQSLINELKGHVLYVCVNNQLVEQTMSKATECGISFSARYKSDWYEENSFNSAETFCITNYASVFNSRSVFHKMDIDAIIFDDAHVAENIIRSQFTLTIKNEHILFSKIINIFRPYFSKTCFGYTFEDVASGAWGKLIYIPMFLVNDSARQLRKLFLEEEIEDSDSNKFPWEYLKDNLNNCCILISGRSIEITPPVVPLHKMDYFNSSTRRIYLTATIPTQAMLIRTFGRKDVNIISPSGKSGDAQRLFVFLSGENDEEHRKDAISLIEHRKSCVISPSSKKAKDWQDRGYIFKTEDGHSKIEEFANSNGSDMLILGARYDGIDLPGKACQILVLDRLPMGESLYETFIDQSIQIETIRNSHTATRIVQAIGRIFRSNTDHGVVMLCGGDLQRWILSPKNQKLLPDLLQKQLQLSIQLINKINNEEVTYKEVIGKIINGNKEWDGFYKSYIEQFNTQKIREISSGYIDLLINERLAYLKLWDGQYSEAATSYLELAEKAGSFERRLAAWYYHWAALSFQLLGNEDEAFSNYIIAANERIELGKPTIKSGNITFESNIKPKFQAKILADYYKKNRSKIFDICDSVKSDIQYGDKTSKTEEAIKILGSLLGLESYRPDKKSDTGPDVIWVGEDIQHLVSFELKTDKNKEGKYSKDDIRACNDHHVWLEKKYSDYNCFEAIVGRILKVDDKANPSENLLIIELDQFTDLCERVIELYKQVSSANSSKPEVEFERWLRHFGLIMPQCVDALKCSKATDLKNVE